MLFSNLEFSRISFNNAQQFTVGSGLSTSSKGNDNNSVRRVTEMRRVQGFRRRHLESVLLCAWK